MNEISTDEIGIESAGGMLCRIKPLCYLKWPPDSRSAKRYQAGDLIRLPKPVALRLAQVKLDSTAGTTRRPVWVETGDGRPILELVNETKDTEEF